MNSHSHYISSRVIFSKKKGLKLTHTLGTDWRWQSYAVHDAQQTCQSPRWVGSSQFWAFENNFNITLILFPALSQTEWERVTDVMVPKKKSLQVRHSSVAVKFFVSFKLSRTNSNYLEWRAISPGQCAKTWADLSSGPQVNAACPRWIMVTQGFFLGAELSCFFLHFFFCSGLGSLFFHCFSSSFHQFSNCFR